MLKLTAEEVEQLVESGKVIEIISESDNTNGKKLVNAVVNLNEKFYSIEYIKDTVLFEVIAWKQEAKEVEEVEIKTYIWKYVN